MSTPRWRSGNRVRLLENGEAYFPAVFEAIAQARHEVMIETFILFEDKVGLAAAAALIAAARRGVAGRRAWSTASARPTSRRAFIGAARRGRRAAAQLRSGGPRPGRAR